jgi:hypothetical protein
MCEKQVEIKGESSQERLDSELGLDWETGRLILVGGYVQARRLSPTCKEEPREKQFNREIDGIPHAELHMVRVRLEYAE